MTLWIVKLSHGLEVSVNAPHCDVEHNSLVFRETAGGIVRAAFAPEQWKTVAIVPDTPEPPADIFGAATRDIVQG